MERQDFRKRFLRPVAIVFVVMTASWIIYNTAWRLDDRSLHQSLAAISGTLLFLSVTFGTLFIYPTAFFRGASPRERILACLINPFLWATKENIRLYISYSFAECLYYYLNPLSIWLFLGIVTQMGLAEMVCRWRQLKTGEEVKVLAPGPLAAFVIGLFLTVSLFAWGQGENVYVIFLAGYRKLFGSGL
jgi:hypothetical protein